jgi:hypothetical protein
MAIAFVNGNAGFSAGSTGTVASAAFVLTAGNTVIVGIRNGNDTIPVLSVADTAGNVYRFAGKTKVASQTNAELWYCTNCLGNATNVVTATLSGADASRGIALVQFSGLATVSPLDVLENDFKASGADILSTAWTTGVANSVVIAFCNIANTGTAWTVPAGYTQGCQDASNVTQMIYQIFSSIQTAQTVTGKNTDASAKTLITSSFHVTISGGGGGETSSVF